MAIFTTQDQILCMKKIILCCYGVLVSALLVGQTNISIDSVKSHIGEKVMVCDEVYGVKTTEKLTYINLGSAYPNAPLTVLIFSKDLVNFPESPEKLYRNQQVCVTGLLKEYKGRTEIIISKPDELKVL
jgi:DNA/RNA endonuclease YhcR with UshA esterase domain